MNIFEEVKGAVSVKDAAPFYGLAVKRNGMAVCPFHTDKNPSMKVDKRFHCFGCGADGDVINFVERLFGLSAIEAARKLAEDFHLNIPLEFHRESKEERQKRLQNERELGRKRKIEEAFNRWWQNTCNTYAAYHRILHRWLIDFEPQGDLENVDERYVEACHQIDFISWRLDDMWFHWNSKEKLDFYMNGKQEVKRIEERVRQIESER